MWIRNFGFRPMSDEALSVATAQFRILVFPGSRMLCKPVPPLGEAGEGLAGRARALSASLGGGQWRGRGGRGGGRGAGGGEGGSAGGAP